MKLTTLLEDLRIFGVYVNDKLVSVHFHPTDAKREAEKVGGIVKLVHKIPAKHI